MGSDYQFFTEWRVPGTVDEVKAVLGDAASLTRWWPSVYLAVTEVDPGGEGGLGRALDLHTKGWLPYTLRWTLRAMRKGDESLCLEMRRRRATDGAAGAIPPPPPATFSRLRRRSQS